MKTLTLVMAAIMSFVMLAGSASAAQWVKDPGSCPQTYSGQNCVPNYVCGLIGSVAQCNVSSIWIPDTYYASNQSQVSVSLATGYVLNCLAPTTCQGQWSCQVNSTCEDASNNWITNCTLVTNSVCAKQCKSGYTDCGLISGGTWDTWPKCNATSVAWCVSPMIYDPCTGTCSDIYVRLNASNVPPAQSGNASISGDFYLGRLLKVGSTSFMNSTHVGIGVSAGAANLHIYDTANNNNFIRLEDINSYSVDIRSGITYFEIRDAAGNTPFTISKNAGAFANSGIYITDAGHVGIGTSGGSSQLEVGSESEGNITVIGGGDASNYATLSLATTATKSWSIQHRQDRVNQFELEYYNGVASYSTPFVITPGGNVGIGTTNPVNAKLNVSGNVSMFGTNTGVIFNDKTFQTTAAVASVSPWDNSSLTTFVRDGYPQGVNISANLTVGSTSFINGTNAGIGTTTPRATLDIADTIQNAARIVLSGQEFYQAGQTMTSGVALLLGVNRAGNKQLWIGDSSALTQNSTNVLLRVLPSTSGTGYVQIDAIATDGTTTKNLSLQGGGGSVGIGTTTPGRLVEMYNTDPVLRLRDTGATASATAAFIEFGGTDGGVWTRTGYIGDDATNDRDITIQSQYGNIHVASGDLIVDNNNFIVYPSNFGLVFNRTTMMLGLGIEQPTVTLDVNGNAKISGNVGIGASPAYKLDVAGAANLNKNTAAGIALNVYGQETIYYNGYFSWGYGGSYNYFADSVIVGGTGTTPSYTIHSQGTIGMNTFSQVGADPMCWDGAGASAIGDCTSLRELKKNINDYEGGLDDVLKLRPRTFDMINGSSRHVGFVAEEVAEAVPSLAKYRDDNLTGYQEFGMSALLVNAVKEQQQQIDELKSQNAMLEARIKALEGK